LVKSRRASFVLPIYWLYFLVGRAAVPAHGSCFPTAERNDKLKVDTKNTVSTFSLPLLAFGGSYTTEWRYSDQNCSAIHTQNKWKV